MADNPAFDENERIEAERLRGRIIDWLTPQTVKNFNDVWTPALQELRQGWLWKLACWKWGK